MATVITPDKIQIWIADTGTDPFDSENSSRSEVKQISEIRFRGAEKDIDLKNFFGSTVDDRSGIVTKPATLWECELVSAVFDMQTFKEYFAGSSLAERETETFALGIQFTTSGGTTIKIKADPAYVTLPEIEATAEDAVSATITIKARPADVTWTVA